jgi:hypothetical protein
MDEYLSSKENIMQKLTELKCLVESELEVLECLPYSLFRYRHDVEHDKSVYKYHTDLYDLRVHLSNCKHRMENRSDMKK